MSFYVVTTDSGQIEHDHGSPDIYGPFATAEQADAFADSFPVEPRDGGYTSVSVIRPGEQYDRPSDAWWLDPDDVDEDDPDAVAEYRTFMEQFEATP